MGALARHQDLSIHPDRKAPRFDADDRAHPRHAVGTDGDDLPGSHQTLVDPLPSPVRGRVALTRRRATFAPEPSANKMVARKKPLEIFVGCANIAHGSTSTFIIWILTLNFEHGTLNFDKGVQGSK